MKKMKLKLAIGYFREVKSRPTSGERTRQLRLVRVTSSIHTEAGGATQHLCTKQQPTLTLASTKDKKDNVAACEAEQQCHMT